jgi:uncharacterized repeat protein (TIGR02543 family)
MKKLILLFVLLLTFTIVGCGNNTNVTVSFDSKGGTEVADIKVEKGSTIQKPTSPEKEGYIFDGWYKEKECINKWDFEIDTVKLEENIEEIKLYAKWIEE